MEDLELLEGTVAAVVYQNAENGYAVLRLSCGGQAVSVVGTIPLPVPGERLVITGRWANNANYGKQFEAEFLERYRALTTALLRNPGVCAFCYTQLTDVEQEVNGLYTYERKPKFDMDVIKAINARKAAIED